MRRKQMGAVNPLEDDLRRNHPCEQRLVDATKAVEMQIWIEKLIRSPCTWPMGIFGRKVLRELGLWEENTKKGGL